MYESTWSEVSYPLVHVIPDPPPIPREVLEHPFKVTEDKLSNKAHLLRMKWPPTRPYKQRRWNKG